MKRLGNLLLVAFALVAIAGLVGCASAPGVERNPLLIGTWRMGEETNNPTIVVRTDGSASRGGLQMVWTSQDGQLKFIPKATADMYGINSNIANASAFVYDYILDGDILKLNGVEYKKVQ